MAWGRTSMMFMVTAAVLLRWMSHYGVCVAVIAGGLLTVALGIFATQRTRYRRAAEHVAGLRSGASTGAVLGLSICAVLLGVAGIWFVLLGN